MVIKIIVSFNRNGQGQKWVEQLVKNLREDFYCLQLYCQELKRDAGSAH